MATASLHVDVDAVHVGKGISRPNADSTRSFVATDMQGNGEIRLLKTLEQSVINSTLFRINLGPHSMCF